MNFVLYKLSLLVIIAAHNIQVWKYTAAIKAISYKVTKWLVIHFRIARMCEMLGLWIINKTYKN